MPSLCASEGSLVSDCVGLRFELAGATLDEMAQPGDAGTCVFVECTQNDECTSFFEPACVDYTCVECAVDADCSGAMESCVANQCVVEPECGVEGLPECPEGQSCFAGFCAVPAGTCSDPEVVTDGTYMGSSAGQGSDHTGSAVCGFGSGNGPEAVFAYTPTLAGEICVSTSGSSYDTVLYVRQGVCDMQSAELTCNDDADQEAFTTTSEVRFAAQPDV